MKKYKDLLKYKWFMALGLGAIIIVGFVAAGNDQKNFEVVKNLDIFYSLFRELNGYYVDETDPEKLIKTGIDAMLESLDPYTTLIPESEMEGFRFMTTGEYAGIGALITKRDNYVVISEPYEGFPAQVAGLKAGDKILEINGESMASKNTEQVSEKLKGPAQTEVKLTIERPGTKGNIEIPITRRVIQINAVPYYGMLNSETGIIILNNFTSNCSMEIEKAFNDLKTNRGMKSLILDMRGNPGGLLDEAVKVANLFIPRGSEVVSTKGKISQWDKTYRAPREPIDTEMPMAVLISRGSASASEIVAGALQDYDRALIIGQRSFGKGLVQATRNLSYNAKLKITTAKYYIPSGRCIQAVDYSNRNDDGSVGYVPDSLIREFSTQGGRKVFDGGGISPDVTVPAKKYSNLTVALLIRQTLFDYATDYVLKHPAIAPPQTFKLTDEDYSSLKQYVASLNDFKYQSESQENLKKLVETARREGYYDNVSDALTQLEKDLAPDVEKDMDVFREEVVQLFTLELMHRYYYQKGAIVHSLNDDPEVTKAIETLSNGQQYTNMLNGTVLTHAGDKRELNQKE